jgi:hypothetical protein
MWTRSASLASFVAYSSSRVTFNLLPSPAMR